MQHIHYFTVYFIHCSVGSTIKALVEKSSLFFNAYLPFFETIILRSNSNWRTSCCTIVDPLLKTPALSWILIFVFGLLPRTFFQQTQILLTAGTNRAVHANFSHAWNRKKLCFTWILIVLNPSWIFTVCGCVCAYIPWQVWPSSQFHSGLQYAQSN